MLNRLLGSLAKNQPAEEEVPFEDLPPEEQEEVLAEEKKQRIKWHRDHVRNGPRNFAYVSTGQQRRAQERAKKSHERKINRDHRRRWKQGQWNLAVLRGQLQAVGALPYATDFEPTTAQRVAAGQWIVGAFGERYPEDVYDLAEHTDSGEGVLLHRKGDIVLSDQLFPNAVTNALDAYVRDQRSAA